MNSTPTSFFSPGCALGAAAITPLWMTLLLYGQPKIPDELGLVWLYCLALVLGIFVAGALLATRLKTKALLICAVAGVALAVAELAYFIYRSNQAVQAMVTAHGYPR